MGLLPDMYRAMMRAGIANWRYPLMSLAGHYSVMAALLFISIYNVFFTPTHKPYGYDPYYMSLWIHRLVGNDLDQTDIIEITREACHVPHLDMHLLYMHLVHSWHLSVRMEFCIYLWSFYTKGADVEPYYETCKSI